MGQIARYLELTEHTVEELFQLNKSFQFFESSLYDKLLQIDQRSGEVKIQEFNELLSQMHIKFDQKGLKEFDERYLTTLIVHTNQDAIRPMITSVLGEETPSTPFLTEPRDPNLKYSLVLDLDETLIYFPEEEIVNFHKDL